MRFQKIILSIASVFLLLILVFIGIALTKSRYDSVWPPVVGDCPDFWVDMSGNGEACYNSKSLGKCNIPSDADKNVMNFNQPPFNSNDGVCSKYNWAKGCDITWDGITSGVSNPCDTSNDEPTNT